MERICLPVQEMGLIPDPEDPTCCGATKAHESQLLSLCSRGLKLHLLNLRFTLIVFTVLVYLASYGDFIKSQNGWPDLLQGLRSPKTHSLFYLF